MFSDGSVVVPVVVAMFMAGVIFTLGRYSVRIEHLEEWRIEFERRFDTHMDRLEKLITEGHD